jgi:RNA-binding protein EWS
MALTDYSTSGQAAVQQGYSAYTTQPTQGYAQTTQAYGQQGYGTYGQPTDVSYTVTYGHTTHTTSYGQSPTGSTNVTAPQAYRQPAQGIALAQMTPTLLWSPPLRPPMQLSLHLSCSLLI